jgi:thiamine-phosphate pyrophosphorylase
MKAEVKGLYAVTPDTADTAELLARVEAALAGGAKLLQYRNKTASAALRLVQARALLAPCREHHVPLIINDHLELALALDAHGLHLGSEDGSVAAARYSASPATAGSRMRVPPLTPAPPMSRSAASFPPRSSREARARRSNCSA